MCRRSAKDDLLSLIAIYLIAGGRRFFLAFETTSFTRWFATRL
jgi:hypothetical protein